MSKINIDDKKNKINRTRVNEIIWKDFVKSLKKMKKTIFHDYIRDRRDEYH